MVSEAVILAGGLGTRMLPASLYSAKEALPLIDTPILNHLVWECARAGVKRVHIVLSQRKKDLLDGFLRGDVFGYDGVRPDLPRNSLALGTEGMEIIPHVQLSPGGVADAISVALENVESEFLVLLGDMLLMESHFGPNEAGPENASGASKRLVDAFEKNGLPCVGLFEVEDEEVSKYGIAEISNGMVMGIEEKPEETRAKNNYALCGRYIFPKNTKGILERFPVSEFGEMQSILLMNYMIENGGLNGVILEGMEMYDSGDPVSWLKSQVDHGLRRQDTSSDLLEWLTNRLSRI